MKKIILSIMSFTLLFILVSCSSKVLVTFNSDGGTECESIEVEAGTTIVLPTEPTKEGHKFLGWYLNDVLFDETTVINRNITLVAKWDATKYNISYEIGEQANMSQDVVKQFDYGKGTTVKLPKPTKSGYVFKGWYENEQLVTSLTENRNYNLVAKWETAQTFEVILKVDGEVYDSLSAVEGETLKDAQLPTNPTKEGFDNNKYLTYAFDGWYLNDQEYDFENEIVTSDLVLNAKFNATHQTMIQVGSYNLPLTIKNHFEKKEEKTNKQTEFFDRTQSYLVGDDNNWQFLPNLIFLKHELDADGAITEQYEEVLCPNWEYNIVIYEYNPTTDKYDILVDNNDENVIDAIDNKTCEINFADKDSTLERAYLVKVSPKGLGTNQSANINDYTIEMKIEVVDGFNANNAKELAYINDRTDEYEQAWNQFKTLNNLQLNYAPTRVILHNDIKLTDKDVPSEFFYTAEDAKGAEDAERLYKTDDGKEYVIKLEGSLKDYSNIYLRNLHEGKQFTLSGNYFDINVSEFPLVIRERKDGIDKPCELGTVISHATLFKMNGDDTGRFDMNNIRIIGNSNRTELAFKGGGLILTKISDNYGTMYNNLTSQSFITYMSETSDKEVLIEKCKSYDAFNCFVYNWGHSNLKLLDCEMIGAGGPAIIQDHIYHNTDGTGGEQGKITIENCNIEAYVTGTEGWFTLVNASSVVPTIKGMDLLFNAMGRSFVKTGASNSQYTYMNLVLVNKSGNAQGLTGEKISGSTTIKQNDKAYTFDFGATNPIIKAMLESTFGVTAAFESSEGGYCYVNQIEQQTVLTEPTATGGYNILTNPYDETVKQHNMYKGDYLALYYNGMEIILGYFNAGQTYTE